MSGWGSWIAGAAKNAVNIGQNVLDSVTSIDDEIAQVEKEMGKKPSSRRSDNTRVTPQQGEDGRQSHAVATAGGALAPDMRSTNSGAAPKTAPAQKDDWGTWDDPSASSFSASKPVSAASKKAVGNDDDWGAWGDDKPTGGQSSNNNWEVKKRPEGGLRGKNGSAAPYQPPVAPKQQPTKTSSASMNLKKKPPVKQNSDWGEWDEEEGETGNLPEESSASPSTAPPAVVEQKDQKKKLLDQEKTEEKDEWGGWEEENPDEPKKEEGEKIEPKSSSPSSTEQQQHVDPVAVADPADASSNTTTKPMSIGSGKLGGPKKKIGLGGAGGKKLGLGGSTGGSKTSFGTGGSNDITPISTPTTAVPPIPTEAPSQQQQQANQKEKAATDDSEDNAASISPSASGFPTTTNDGDGGSSNSKKKPQKEISEVAESGILGLGIGGLTSVMTSGMDLALQLIPEEEKRKKEEDQLHQEQQKDSPNEEPATDSDKIHAETSPQEATAEAEQQQQPATPAEPPLDILRAARGKLEINRRESPEAYPKPSSREVSSIEEVLDPMLISDFEYDDDVAERVAWVKEAGHDFGEKISTLRTRLVQEALANGAVGGEQLSPQQLAEVGKMENIPIAAKSAADQIGEVLLEELVACFAKLDASQPTWLVHNLEDRSDSLSRDTILANNILDVCTFALCEMAAGSQRLGDAAQECWMWAKKSGEKSKDEVKAIKERTLTVRGECFVASTDAASKLEEALECVIVLFPFVSLATSSTTTTTKEEQPATPKKNTVANTNTSTNNTTSAMLSPTSIGTSLAAPPSTPQIGGGGHPAALATPPAGSSSTPITAGDNSLLASPLNLGVSARGGGAASAMGNRMEDSLLAGSGRMSPPSSAGMSPLPSSVAVAPPSTPANNQPLEEMSNEEIQRLEQNPSTGEVPSPSLLLSPTKGTSSLVAPPTTPQVPTLPPPEPIVQEDKGDVAEEEEEEAEESTSLPPDPRKATPPPVSPPQSASHFEAEEDEKESSQEKKAEDEEEFEDW